MIKLFNPATMLVTLNGINYYNEPKKRPQPETQYEQEQPSERASQSANQPTRPPGWRGGRVTPCRCCRECHFIILALGGKVSSGPDNQEEGGVEGPGEGR